MTRKKAKASTDTGEIAERSMKFFMSSIRDPQKVMHCGRCLYGALLLSTADPERPIDTPEKLPTSIRKNLEFWNLLLSFLVTPRTDEEVDRILTSFSQCSCHLTDPNISQYHRAAQLAEAGSMNRTWMEYYAPPSEKSKYSTARCAFVIKGFTVLYSGLKEGGIKSVAKDTTRTWPGTPADLMPFGPDELVKTMLQWYRFAPDPIVVQLITRILHTARHTLIPSLYKYRLAHSFVDYARNIFDLTVVELQKPRPASDKAYLTATTANLMRYHYILQGVLDFLNEVLNELPCDCIADIILGCETKFMQLCSLIVYLSSDPCMVNHEANEKAIDSFTRHGFSLYRLFHMHLPPRPDIPLHPDIVKLDEKIFPPTLRQNCPEDCLALDWNLPQGRSVYSVQVSQLDTKRRQELPTLQPLPCRLVLWTRLSGHRMAR